jgi:2-methylcitrate dehydratase PrpD
MALTEETIARFIAETSEADIPAAALQWANLGSFDCVGVMMAGAASPPGKIMTKFTREAGGIPETTVVGTGLRTSAVMGAQANGALAHALDYDDMGGSFGHPSCVLLPPLISLGERMNASGRDILNAYTIGFEVGCALSKGCHFVQGEVGYHSTSMYGTMAATAACARLLHLNAEQTNMAMGIAGSMPSGVLQNFGTYTKGLHAGLASRNGVMACLLAKDGWKGADNIFESRVGFLHTYVGKDKYNLETIRDALGKWFVVDSIVIKKYPCCGSNHSALDSILALIHDNDIDFEDIEQVEVDEVPYISHILLYPNPTYGFQGKFSIHYNAATAMIDKHIDIDSYTDAKLHRPEFKEALSRLNVHVMPPWDPNFRPGATANPITIKLKDGRVFHQSTNRHIMHGTPTDPLTDEELVGKFRYNAGLVLSQKDADQATEIWRNLEDVGNIGQALATVAGQAT